MIRMCNSRLRSSQWIVQQLASYGSKPLARSFTAGHIACHRHDNVQDLADLCEVDLILRLVRASPAPFDLIQAFCNSVRLFIVAQMMVKPQRVV